MSETRNLRRYALHKRRAAEEALSIAIRDVWAAKQEAEPGVILPSDFPSKAALSASYYTTYEDLDGADTNELVALGLTEKQAAAVLAAAG
jgi:hypothetical protein